MSKKREMSESGMLVYPKLPVPTKRGSEPRLPSHSNPVGSGGRGRLAFFMLLLGLAGGAAGGFVLRPMLFDGGELAETKNELAKEKLATAEAMQNLAKEKEASKKLDEQRELLDKQLEAAKQAQDMIADKDAASAKTKGDLDGAKKKLEGTGAGTVTVEGNELHLAIADSKLFKSGDELSAGGQKVLDKVAGALKELGDKQIAVHGHTDDQPPPKPAAPKPPKNKKDKTPPPPPAAEPEFATNWELSSGRALAVVHYFQDTHKIEATRLSASAFSQYHPASKTNKAANRRIEIVLTGKGWPKASELVPPGQSVFDHPRPVKDDLMTPTAPKEAPKPPAKEAPKAPAKGSSAPKEPAKGSSPKSDANDLLKPGKAKK